MRTRFVGTEFRRSFPVQTLDFFRCPLSYLPSTHGSTLEELQHCFDDLSVFNIPLQIEKLQIEDSLRNFLSGVLPQILQVKIGDLVDDQSRAASACVDLWSCGIDHVVGINRSPEIDDTAFVGIEKNGLETLQFEVPEQDHNYQSHMENMMNFFEIAKVHDILDMPTFELREQDFREILHSIVSVVNDFTDYGVETKVHPVEDSGLTELDFHPTAFFLLEVDEASMKIFNDMPVEGALTTLLHIEFQKVAEDDDIVKKEMEFLYVKKIDLLEYLSDPSLEMQVLDVELPPPNLLTDLNFIDHSEGLQHGEMMLHQRGKSDDDLAWLEGILLFEVFSFLDLEMCSVCEVSLDLAKVMQVEACEDMFGEAMKFRSFNELIVCNELTLGDDIFKTLPAPILSGNQKVWSLESFFQESLKELELEFPFDGLYLDWHVLEEESGGKSTYSSCWRYLEDNDTGRIYTVLNCNDYEILVLNFVLSDDSLVQGALEESKEVLNIPLHDISTPVCVNEIPCDKTLNDKRKERDYGELESEKVLLSFNLTTQVSDSDDSFLNSQKCVRGLNCNPFEKSVDSSKLLFLDCAKDSIAACGATELPLLGWNVKLQRIKLSDEILEILDNLGKNFLFILESDKELKDTVVSSQGLDDLSLLRIPKEKLIYQIEKAGSTGTLPSHGSEKLMSLVALCAIKQMAWYLCYYGFHSTYLYISKLVEGMQCLTDRLNFMQNLMKLYEKAEKEIVKFHPSFSVVKELLECNVCQSSKKMLIVTERFFWWPLKRLLKSMKISCNEPQNFVTHAYQGNESSGADAKKITFPSDCCLVSHEYINSSFPFSQFHAVLEYGGPSASSKISTSFPELDDFPLLYFLKVDVEDSALAKALCHGVDTPKPFSSRTKDDCHLISMMSNTKNNVIELLSFMPLENLNLKPLGSVDVDVNDACSTMLPCVPQFTESEKINGDKPSFLGTVIIVNTQNLDKEMIISRRSTYQRILACEKLGVEVVERDLDLPVDILVDAEVCLAWYELKNIRRKASAADEAFSCLPLCIENIAASILTSLSLAFSSCILIFEGEKGFVAGVMESSDELYAAAASLGIDLQIFYSYSSDMTDKILLSTIETAANIRGASYPKMSESESLGESFLAAFPSINPLSAHAILSYGGTIAEFLELSLDCRVQAVQKFNIPGEAVSLFTLLTKYGEREDSKSGMTDSSSSVSYAPAMQKYQMKSYFDNKKRKYDEDLLDVDIHGNQTDIEPLKLFSDGRSNPSKAACSNDFWGSENLDAFGELEKPGLCFNKKLFGQREELDANMIKGTSFVSPANGFQTAGVPLTSEKMKNGDNSWNDVVFADEVWDGPSMRSMKQHKKANLWNQTDDFVGEVIDIDGPTSLDVSNAYFASSPACIIGKDPSEQAHGVAKKLFSSSNSLPSFSISAKNKFEKGSCFPIDNRQKGSARTDGYYLNSSFNKCAVEDNALTAASNIQDLPANEGECYGGTPLWNAVHSSECIGQSPWTIEFLNRIKAKSKTREHALPPDLSAPCVGRSRSTTKAMKKKSPSVLEFYRYEGGSVGKTVQQREKWSLQKEGSSKSRNRRTSAPAQQTWTPLDKRAKRTLSFATTGNGAQSKLIWSDKKSQATSSRMVHQV